MRKREKEGEKMEGERGRKRVKEMEGDRGRQ